jgi:hypothetical protein
MAILYAAILAVELVRSSPSSNPPEYSILERSLTFVALILFHGPFAWWGIEANLQFRSIASRWDIAGFTLMVGALPVLAFNLYTSFTPTYEHVSTALVNILFYGATGLVLHYASMKPLGLQLNRQNDEKDSG